MNFHDSKTIWVSMITIKSNFMFIHVIMCFDSFFWKPFQSPKLACATTCRCIHLLPSAAMAPKLSTMKAMKTSMKVAMNSMKATKMGSKKDTSKSAMP